MGKNGKQPLGDGSSPPESGKAKNGKGSAVAETSSGRGLGSSLLCFFLGTVLGMASCAVVFVVLEERPLLDIVSQVRLLAGTDAIGPRSGSNCPPTPKCPESKCPPAKQPKCPPAPEPKCPPAPEPKCPMHSQEGLQSLERLKAESKQHKDSFAAANAEGQSKVAACRDEHSNLRKELEEAQKARETWAAERADLMGKIDARSSATVDVAQDSKHSGFVSKGKSAQIALSALDSAELRACDDGKCANLKDAMRTWRRAIDSLSAAMEGDDRMAQMVGYVEQISGDVHGLEKVDQPTDSDEFKETYAAISGNNRQVFEAMRGYLMTVAKNE